MAENETELNAVGQALTSLLAEKYGIPEENLKAWTADADGDAVEVECTLFIEMTLEEFNELLERARSIAAPVNS